MHDANPTPKKTPLYESHVAAHAKMIPFGDWLMPLSYEGVLAEHAAVRTHCGVFDVSHMGEITIAGRDAKKFLQHLTINDVERIAPGQGQYSAMLNPEGGFIDDLIVYCLAPDRYLLCVNASNSDKDFAWVGKQASGFVVDPCNESANWAQIAVQGPTSLQAVQSVLQPSDVPRLEKLTYMEIAEFPLAGARCLIARTGYTGETGVELYLPNSVAAAVWSQLLATAPATGIKPVGLGARDTLRLEACYLLYGNDMDDSISPLEAGIGWAVRLDCGDFIGKPALLAQKERGLGRVLVAFKMIEGAIPRSGMEVWSGESKVGRVTSGSALPTVGGAGGMALVDFALRAPGTQIAVDVRGKRKLAEVVKRPLYSARTK